MVTFEQIRTLLAAQSGVDEGQIWPDMKLRDLFRLGHGDEHAPYVEPVTGMTGDSMDIVELIMSLDDDLDVGVPDTETHDFESWFTDKNISIQNIVDDLNR